MQAVPVAPKRGLCQTPPMQFNRFYTAQGADVYTGVRFHTVTTDDRHDYTVPSHWSGAAIETLIETVFCKKAIPAMTVKTGESGVPRWLCPSRADEAQLESVSAEWRYVFEQDVRQVFDRIAGGLTYRGWKLGIFGDETAALSFYDELRFILLHQIALPEMAILAAIGLDWAYGRTAETPNFRQKVKTPASALGAKGASFLFEQDGNEDLPPQQQADRLSRRLRALGELLSLETVTNAKTSGLSVTMAVMDADQPVVSSFIRWKEDEELKQASLQAGRKVLDWHLMAVMDACDRDDFEAGFDPDLNPDLSAAVAAARRDGVPSGAIEQAIARATAGDETMALFPETGIDKSYDALRTALRFRDDFIESAITHHSLPALTQDGSVRHIRAHKIWQQAAQTIWACGEPVLFFNDTVAQTALLGGKTKDFLPAAFGGFVSPVAATAPETLINLGAFVADTESTKNNSANNSAQTGLPFAADALAHVVRVMTVALDLCLLPPLGDVDAGTLYSRPVSIGYTGLAALLMSEGFSYDSDAARKLSASVTAFITAQAFMTSADLAKKTDPCPGFRDEPGACVAALKTMTTTADRAGLPKEIRDLWRDMIVKVQSQGLRNLFVTSVGGGREDHLLTGAATRGITPEIAPVRFDGDGKRLAPAAEGALRKLGYPAATIADIYFYAAGHGTLMGAPAINHDSLREKGFVQAALDAVESALHTAQHIRYAFNKWTLGLDFCQLALDLDESDLDDPAFDMLSALGFSELEIEQANLYCCGAGTLLNAPPLKPEHETVFDSRDHIPPQAELDMQAAIEPFLSGAVDHTILLPLGHTAQDVEKLMLRGFEKRVKLLRLTRSGASLLHEGLVRGQSDQTAQNAPSSLADMDIRAIS